MRRLEPIIVTAFVIGASGAACSSPVESSSKVVTMAHIDDDTAVLDPAVAWFVDEVAATSDGRLTIEVDYTCCGADAAVEQTLVRGVADGEWDLGWVGTRVFADLGFAGYSALTAPLAVDGYDVQEAVLADDALVSAMGAGLADDLGVFPISVAPGPLRKPISAAPLLDPVDWSGAAAYHFPSAQSAAAFRALGAVPTSGSFVKRDEGLNAGTIDVIEASLSFHSGGRREFVPYATVNVNLWPRISAIVADPRAADALSEAQLGWLVEAAERVVARTAELEAIDADFITESCEWGARYPVASDSQLEALRAAVAPLHRELAQDPVTADALDRISKLRTAAKGDAALPVPASCTGAAPAPRTPGTDDPAAIDGVFTTIDWTEDALLEAGAGADVAAEFGTFEFSFSTGEFGLVNTSEEGVFRCTGTYTVDDATVTVRLDPGQCGSGGELFTASFEATAEGLRLTDVVAAAPVDAVLFGAEPLSRVD